MAGSDNNDLSENISVRLTKRDKRLLEEICKARGEDPSDFVRRAIRKEFASLSYLPEAEKKALGIVST